MPPAGDDLLGGWATGMRAGMSYLPSTADFPPCDVVSRSMVFPSQEKGVPPSASENSPFTKPSSGPYLEAFLLESEIC